MRRTSRWSSVGLVVAGGLVLVLIATEPVMAQRGGGGGSRGGGSGGRGGSGGGMSRGGGHSGGHHGGHHGGSRGSHSGHAHHGSHRGHSGHGYHGSSRGYSRYGYRGPSSYFSLSFGRPYGFYGYPSFGSYRPYYAPSYYNYSYYRNYVPYYSSYGYPSARVYYSPRTYSCPSSGYGSTYPLGVTSIPSYGTVVPNGGQSVILGEATPGLTTTELSDRTTLLRPATTSPGDEAAWKLLSEGKTAEALTTFAALATSSPQAGRPKAGYAVAAALAGDHRAAVAAIRRAIEVDGKSVHYVVIDDALRGRIEGLVAEYLGAEGAGLPKADAQFMTGALQFMLHDDEAAKGAAEAAIEAGDASAAARRLVELLGEGGQAKPAPPPARPPESLPLPGPGSDKPAFP